LPCDFLAEEEGFDFPQYEVGIRWHTLVRYTEGAANKGFTKSQLRKRSSVGRKCGMRFPRKS